MSLKLSPSKWAAILAKTRGRCAYCGVNLAATSWTADHVASRVSGGDNSLENLVPACSSCNSTKGALSIHDPEQAAEFRFRLALRSTPMSGIITPAQHKRLVAVGVLPPLEVAPLWFELEGLSIVGDR